MSEALLEALAWQAVVTPSIEAPIALDVLADALLEIGGIREPWKPQRWTERYKARHAWRARRYLRQQAWEWAVARTKRQDPLEGLMRAVKSMGGGGGRPVASQIVMSPKAFEDFRRWADNVDGQIREAMGIRGLPSEAVPPGSIVALHNDRVDAFTYALQSVPRHGEDPTR